MEKGLKNLQAAARTASRSDQDEDDNFDDSGIALTRNHPS